MASARADRRDCPSEAWGPRDKTHTPPLDALDRAEAAGTVGTGPEKAVLHGEVQGGKRVKRLGSRRAELGPWPRGISFCLMTLSTCRGGRLHVLGVHEVTP